MFRMPKKGRCVICNAVIVEKDKRLRKTCSDDCYKAQVKTVGKQYAANIKKFERNIIIMRRERKSFLEKNYKSNTFSREPNP